MKAVAISRWALLVFFGMVLTACGVSKPKPAQIPAIKADKAIQALWQKLPILVILGKTYPALVI